MTITVATLSGTPSYQPMATIVAVMLATTKLTAIMAYTEMNRFLVARSIMTKARLILTAMPWSAP